MTGRADLAAPDTWVFLCGIGGDGDPGSLAGAADRLEADAMPLAGGAISVATASVRLDPARHLDEARRCLSAAEAERAARFVKHPDRVRYVLAHAMLRTLLARRLALTPAGIDFAAGPNGKPRLAGAAAGLAFSLSYGKATVALAFARRPVGVDLEAVRDNVAFRDIAGRFFQPDELRYLESGPESGPESGAGPGLRDRFFRLWTRKEAVLKALGVGLGGLGEVSVLDDLVVAGAARGGARRIALRTLPAPPGHALALALETRREA